MNRSILARCSPLALLAFNTLALAQPGGSGPEVAAALAAHGPLLVERSIHGHDVELYWDDLNWTLSLWVDGSFVADAAPEFDDAGRPELVLTNAAGIAVLHIHALVHPDGRPVLQWIQPGFEPLRVTLSSSESSKSVCKCWPPTATGTVVIATCTTINCDEIVACIETAGGVATAHCEWRASQTGG